MKVSILSDLHIEFGDFEPTVTDADVVILAGDTHIGERGIVWAEGAYKSSEVIYISGNHEYYKGAIPKLTEKLQALSSGTNVHFLENGFFEMGDIRFLGCTLWTDFRLHGNLDVAVLFAGSVMNDYRLIRVSPVYRKLHPADTAMIHNKSRSWLKKEIKRAGEDNMKSVVITHHAPSLISVPEPYKKNHISASFASGMDDFILETEPDLWIHGHLHTSSDYKIGATRVICNPRGYMEREENKDFIPGMLIDI